MASRTPTGEVASCLRLLEELAIQQTRNVNIAQLLSQLNQRGASYNWVLSLAIAELAPLRLERPLGIYDLLRVVVEPPPERGPLPQGEPPPRPGTYECSLEFAAILIGAGQLAASEEREATPEDVLDSCLEVLNDVDALDKLTTDEQAEVVRTANQVLLLFAPHPSTSCDFCGIETWNASLIWNAGPGTVCFDCVADAAGSLPKGGDITKLCDFCQGEGSVALRSPSSVMCADCLLRFQQTVREERLEHPDAS